MTNESPTLRSCCDEFRRYKAYADAAVAQIDDAQFFAVLSPGMNSIAIIMNHIAGNMLSRWTDFRTTDGEKPGRDRETEFAPPPADRRQLLEHWERSWQCLFDAVESVRPDEIDSDLVRVRGRQMTVIAAIHRQLAHYSYHVGQIMLLARHFKGADGWHYLTIAPGRSDDFNRSLGHAPPSAEPPAGPAR